METTAETQVVRGTTFDLTKLNPEGTRPIAQPVVQLDEVEVKKLRGGRDVDFKTARAARSALLMAGKKEWMARCGRSSKHQENSMVPC